MGLSIKKEETLIKKDLLKIEEGMSIEVAITSAQASINSIEEKYTRLLSRVKDREVSLEKNRQEYNKEYQNLLDSEVNVSEKKAKLEKDANRAQKLLTSLTGEIE